MSRCQCGCGPSPRQERMPTPVIQASRASAMARDREWVRELVRPDLKMRPEFFVFERHRAESDLGFTYRLAIAGEARLRHREAGAIMHHAGLAVEALARFDEAVQLEAVRADEERPALEFGECDHEP